PFWYRPLALYSEGRRYSPFEDFAIRSIARLTNGLHSPSTLHWQSLRTRSRLRREHRSVIDVHSARPVQFSESELHNMLLFPYSGYSPQTEFDWKLENNPNDGMKSDMSTYMPGDILVKVDRSSMAHGLELRAPFLDRDFAEFCISLPWQLKVTSERDKIILRETYESDWTDRIRRRGKAGFGAPVNKWLMRPTLREIKKDYLDDPSKKLFSLFSFQRTRKVIEEDSQRTWQLLVLGIWLEKGPDSLLGFERLRSQASVVVPNQAK